MILLVIHHALAVAVIVLQHDELVGIVVDAVAQLHDSVEVKGIPPLAFNQCHVEHPLAVVADGLEAGLVDAAVIKDVLVVLAVNDGNPIFGVRHEIGRDVSLAGNGYLVPAA